MSLVKFITVGSIDSVLQHISSFSYFSRPSLNKLRFNNFGEEFVYPLFYDFVFYYVRTVGGV